MLKTKWLSLGVSLGLLCLLTMLALLVTRCTSLTLPTASLATVSVTNQVKSPPAVIANHTVSTTRALTAAQAITHSDWLTFTDSEAGYSIRYPANFILRSGKSKGEMYSTTRIVFNLPTVNMHQEMSIRVEPNPDNLPIGAIVKAIYEDLSNKSLSIQSADALEQITAAGTVAYKTTILPGNADFQILIPYDKKVYRLAMVHALGPSESAPEAKTMFFALLATFQIKNGD